MKKYEVAILRRCLIGTPANHFYTTYYTVSATSKEEAKKKAVTKFKIRTQIKRFLKADWKVTINLIRI